MSHEVKASMLAAAAQWPGGGDLGQKIRTDFFHFLLLARPPAMTLTI